MRLVGHGRIQTYHEDATMDWVVLVAFVLVFVTSCLVRRRDRFLPGSRSAPTAMGVEGFRRLGKQRRAALHAATTMLR